MNSPILATHNVNNRTPQEAQIAFKGCETDASEVAAYERAALYDTEERASLREERDSMADILEQQTATIEAMGMEITALTNQRVIELEAEVASDRQDIRDLESEMARMRSTYEAKIASLEQSN